VGLWKLITVGAVLRFAAEVAARGIAVAMLVWATSLFQKPGSSDPPELFEYLFSFVFAAFGVGAGRGLVCGTRFELTGLEREYAIGLAVTAMIVMVMAFSQGLMELGRTTSVLLSGQRGTGYGWTMFGFVPLMAVMIFGMKWWKARVSREDGAAFLLATAWWTLSAAVVVLGLGLLVQWQMSRQTTVRFWSWTPLVLFQLFPMLIGSASAIPSLRIAARDSMLRRSGCCRSCGYDMTAIEDATQCPECGAAWTPNAIGDANLPTIPAKTP
jgi:hypothetical protein